MKISVVINTYNRATSLSLLLDALGRLEGPEFEVIVVNGPSTDNTAALLETHKHSLRLGTCSDRNLGVSRNVGIEMARGEIVAFIDDDAIPDRYWLRDLAAGYDKSDIAGVGGAVYDPTGYRLQYGFACADRFGNVRPSEPIPLTDYCFPGAPLFPYLQGTNMSFSRDILLEVGGFDEEFEYHLDDTDVCLRMIDAGYRLRQLPDAFVYHRFLPSYIRNPSNVVTNWYPVIKNRAYFALKNTTSDRCLEEIQQETERFVLDTRHQLTSQLRGGQPTREVQGGLDVDSQTALRDGLQRARSRPRRLLGSQLARMLHGPVTQDINSVACGDFRPYPSLCAPDNLTICLLSQEYPPGVTGGIGRFTFSLACGLARRGHNVHVLCRATSDHNSVDYEYGVWVHRVINDNAGGSPPDGVPTPLDQWRYSERIYREILRINERDQVDIVEAPVWEGEGLATILSGRFKTVTSLHTPLKIVRESNLDWIDGSSVQAGWYEGMVATERLVTTLADGVRANSRSVLELMQLEYGVGATSERCAIIPHGSDDPGPQNAFTRGDGMVEVLFVGRFERRKGVDLLLELIPEVCQRHSNVLFTLVGADRSTDRYRRSFSEQFARRHQHEAFISRVVFTGEVSSVRLQELLARCDIFVAPSRYESFGLVYLEAMSFGKPVLGCRTGGVPEVVLDGVTGYLAEPGDAVTLREALECLIVNPEQRREMGSQGRRRFERHFTTDVMVERTLEFYRRVLKRKQPNGLP